MKHLSSKVDLLDYKAHDHKIMHREGDEHIATGRALSLEEELLPPHHGNQQWRWRWWWRMHMAPGAIPRPGMVPEQRLMSPESPLRWRRHCGTFCGDLIRVGFTSRGDV